MSQSDKTPNALELLVGYAEHEGTIRVIEKPSETELRSHNHNLGVYVAVFTAIFVAVLFN